MRYSNPHFQPPPNGLRAEFARMAASPTTAPRPLITMSGWRAIRLPSHILARRLERLIGSVQSHSVSFTFINRIEHAADHVVREVNRRFPSPDPSSTVEVDVVATSMAGLVSRLAAIPSEHRPRLRIARLFTLATPHRGAAIARRVAPDPASRAMKPGSDFLASLDIALPDADFELICYARLRDNWVDARNTAPPGRDPFWTPGPNFLSHHTITADSLLIADIARRIRGEEPLAQQATPPPRN